MEIIVLKFNGEKIFYERSSIYFLLTLLGHVTMIIQLHKSPLQQI